MCKNIDDKEKKYQNFLERAYAQQNYIFFLVFFVVPLAALCLPSSKTNGGIELFLGTVCLIFAFALSNLSKFRSKVYGNNWSCLVIGLLFISKAILRVLS